MYNIYKYVYINKETMVRNMVFIDKIINKLLKYL